MGCPQETLVRRGSEGLRARTKWWFISVVVIAVLLIGVYRYYEFVMRDTWTERDAAMVEAKQQAGVTKTIAVTRSVWDQVCWVVEGTKANGDHIMVWLVDGAKPHIETVNISQTPDTMKSRIEALMPKADIVKLVPGIYNSQYVWQLYYKEGDHYYYRFFRFTDGSPLTEEFTLPNR